MKENIQNNKFQKFSKKIGLWSFTFVQITPADAWIGQNLTIAYMSCAIR
ncbi:Hypothetical protein Minf_1846 [Methylacidiphilum infernorum V4]|uniref:Uncharacterized protein n=1 Tax=Methylacidiphilum infernorum (isolate V4) TaxID=481448 RepID=B3DXU8_METI4|nr:Hypothetical protein Minf_1846 [Methylacidiphilum infernorum V4]